MNKIQIIENGIYFIGNEKLNKYLTHGKYLQSPLEFAELDEESELMQLFYVLYDEEENDYLIISVLLSTQLGFKKHDGNKGSNIYLFPISFENNCKWKIEKIDDDTFYVKSKVNNLYIGMKNEENGSFPIYQSYEDAFEIQFVDFDDIYFYLSNSDWLDMIRNLKNSLQIDEYVFPNDTTNIPINVSEVLRNVKKLPKMYF